MLSNRKYIGSTRRPAGRPPTENDTHKSVWRSGLVRSELAGFSRDQTHYVDGTPSCPSS